MTSGGEFSKQKESATRDLDVYCKAEDIRVFASRAYWEVKYVNRTIRPYILYGILGA